MIPNLLDINITYKHSIETYLAEIGETSQNVPIPSLTAKEQLARSSLFKLQNFY
jgi:hypothetical protein